MGRVLPASGIGVNKPKRGVQLPAASSRQILDAEVGEKGKRLLFNCCTVWKNGRLSSQSLSPPGNRGNPASSSQIKTKDSV